MPRPQLCLGARNVPQELPHLCLSEWMRPELQAGRAAWMDGSSNGDLENGSGATTADELRQGLQAVVVAVIRTESLVETLVGGGVAIRKEVVVVVARGGVVVLMINISIIVVGVDNINVGVVEAMLAEFLVLAFRSGSGGPQLLAV